MQYLPDLGVLLPHLAGVVPERIERTGNQLRLFARARAEAGTCPRCGTVSTRVHGRYRRKLVDAAVAGTRVVLDLLIRRFRCVHTGCAAVTFAEQAEGLTRCPPATPRSPSGCSPRSAWRWRVGSAGPWT